MLPLATDDLISLIGIMRAMRDCARASNWEELARLDSERRVVLEFDNSAAFTEKSGHAEAAHAGALQMGVGNEVKSESGSCSEREALVAEIRSLDAQIINTVETQRKQLLDANRGLSAQLRAKELYARTSSIS